MLRFVPDPDKEIDGSKRIDHKSSYAHLNGYLESYSIDYIQVSRINDVMEGKATVYFQAPHNEEKMECEYSNNKKNGKVKLFDKNGICTFSSTFIDDIIEGSCEMYENGLLVFRGTMSDDNITGYCYQQSNNILIYEGYYKNGKRNGIGREYDVDGSVLSDCVYKNGEKLNAAVTYDNEDNCIMYLYDESDKLSILGIIDPALGILNGLGCRFNSDGSVSDLVRFSNDAVLMVLIQFHGGEMTEFDSNGDMAYKGGFKMVDDLKYIRDGKGVEYGDEQDIIYQGDFKDGNRHGNGKEFNHGVCIYDGGWEKNERNGQGCSFMDGGDVEFNGVWKDGKFVEEIPLYPSVDIPAYPAMSDIPYGYPPEQDVPAYPEQEVPAYPEQEVPAYPPEQDVSAYPPEQDVSAYPPEQDVPAYPEQDVPAYPEQDVPAYPEQDVSAYPEPPLIPAPKASAQEPSDFQSIPYGMMPDSFGVMPSYGIIPDQVSTPYGTIPTTVPYGMIPSYGVPELASTSQSKEQELYTAVEESEDLSFQTKPVHSSNLQSELTETFIGYPEDNQGYESEEEEEDVRAQLTLTIRGYQRETEEHGEESGEETERVSTETEIEETEEPETESEESDYTEEESEEESERESEESERESEEESEEESEKESEESEKEAEESEKESVKESERESEESEKESEESEYTEEPEDESSQYSESSSDISDNEELFPRSIIELPKPRRASPPAPPIRAPSPPPKSSKPAPSEVVKPKRQIPQVLKLVPVPPKPNTSLQPKASLSPESKEGSEWDFSLNSSDSELSDDAVKRFFASQSSVDSQSSLSPKKKLPAIPARRRAASEASVKAVKETDSPKSQPPPPPAKTKSQPPPPPKAKPQPPPIKAKSQPPTKTKPQPPSKSPATTSQPPVKTKSQATVKSASTAKAKPTKPQTKQSQPATKPQPQPPAKPLPRQPPLPAKPSKALFLSSGGLSISAKSLLVEDQFFGAVEHVITVDEMERYFTFFKDLRTRSNFLTLNEVYHFYRQISRGKPIITQIIKLVVGDKAERIYLKDFAIISHLIYLYNQGISLPSQISDEIHDCMVFRFVSDNLSEPFFSKPPYIAIFMNKADPHYAEYSRQPNQVPFSEYYESRPGDVTIASPSQVDLLRTSNSVLLQGRDLASLPSLECSNWSALRSLVIAHSVGASCSVFKITNMHSLEQIIVGEDCFTVCHRNDMNSAFVNYDRLAKQRKVFTVTDCPVLHSIKIGNNSFTDYSSFSISNLPLLHTLEIGKNSTGLDSFDNRSYAFFRCREIQLLNLPFLTCVFIGNYAFYDCESAVFQDLPVLEKLSFGQYSFFNTTYLSLSTLPKCTELIVSPFSFYACESFTGIDISSIRSVSLQMNCFYLLKEITKKNISIQLSMELSKERKFKPKSVVV